MRLFQKSVCAILTAGLVCASFQPVLADPFIMPGAVDITDATSLEDYFPQIKTVDHYDEYGMPYDDTNSLLGFGWYYDPVEELYCKYNNEGELTTQKENPYKDTELKLGDLYIQISYTYSLGLKPDGLESVLYLMNSDGYLYAVRIPCNREADTVFLPEGEYIPYAVQSYDLEQAIIDCPNLPAGCYVPQGGIGHLDLELEVRYNYKQLHMDWSRENSSVEEATATKSQESDDALRESVPQISTEEETSVRMDTSAVPTTAASGLQTSAASTMKQDSLLDYVATENETAETGDGIATAAIFLALAIGVIVLALAVVVLAVYIIALRKKKR